MSFCSGLRTSRRQPRGYEKFRLTPLQRGLIKVGQLPHNHMPEAPMSTTTPTEIIETTECGRCGGTGHYSYNQINGTTCFGCGGTGKALTKRGKLVDAFVRNLRKVSVHDLKVGDRVRIDIGVQSVKTTIKEVRKGPGVIVNGERVPETIITTAGGKTCGYCGPSFAYRILLGEFRAEVIAAATAYRDSLTLAGKPRKDFPVFPAAR